MYVDRYFWVVGIRVLGSGQQCSDYTIGLQEGAKKGVDGSENKNQVLDPRRLPVNVHSGTIGAAVMKSPRQPYDPQGQAYISNATCEALLSPIK